MTDDRSAGRSGRPWLRESLLLFGWAALLAPVGVVVHEFGHYLAALLLGYEDAVLRSANVGGGAKLGNAPDWHVAVQSGAGPLATVLLIALAWPLLRRPHAPACAIALAATAPLRFLVGAVFLGVGFYLLVTGAQRGAANFDEFNLARALGIPVEPLLVAELILLVAVWLKVIRTSLAGRRWIGPLSLIAGGTLGLVVWMNWLGPLLLP